jgi:hypothetical protein
MKKPRNFLSVLAMACGLTAVFASTQQIAWVKPIVGPVTSCGITVPVDTDLQPCLVQAGIQCKCGSRDAYETKEGAEAQDASKLLKYN